MRKIVLNDPDQRKRVVKLGLAALLHDVGKFAQRAEADPERYRSLANLHEFAVPGDRGSVSYHHAAYTWQFIEEHVPWLTRLENPDGNVAQWAARHHKPSSVWDWIVAEADRLSSGMERGHPDEAARGWEQVKSARLTPLLARISDTAAHNFELPMRRLSMSGTAFPLAASGTSMERATVEYRALFESFCRAVAQIPPLHVGRFFESFLSVYETFAWCIPAATNFEPCDVSLFEHSRAASSIAAALGFDVLSESTPREDAVRDRSRPRYLLVVADLGGIQGFVYTIVSSYAARTLRGRSLALQLIADAIGQRMLREFGLPPTSLLYNGGGKLWLLLPASCREPLLELAEQLDFDLSDGGRLSFTVGCAALSGRDLVEKRVSQAWTAASSDMAERRHRRFARAVRLRYDDVFQPFGDPSEACKVCGQLSSELAPLSPDEEAAACPQCRGFAELGNRATRASCMVRIAGDDLAARAERIRSRLQQGSYVPYPLLALETTYLFVEGELSRVAERATADDVVLRINEVPETWAGEAACSMWLAGLNRATADGRALDFDDLAGNSRGIERLGILRMDVDSLGQIFQSGLGKEEATLSRMANLSRGLLYFFGGYVSHLLTTGDWPEHAQLIYSGGDDVFAVGSWSEMPELARTLRREFTRFVGDDRKWGLSGGVEIVLPRFPIAVGARLAGEAEDKAKQFHRHQGGKPKDALTLFGEAFGWEQFDVLDALKDTLTAMFGRDSSGRALLSRATLHRLGSIAELYRESERETASGADRDMAGVTTAIRRGKWAWQAAYALARASGHPKAREQLEHLAGSLSGNEWNGARSDRPLIWLLGPAVTWADLLTRER